MTITEKEREQLMKDSQARHPDLVGEDWPVQYKLVVNTPFESIGKYYHAVLKELRDPAIGGFKNLVKIDQALSASPTSAFYGDVANRKAYAKEQFDKSMGMINSIIQTVMKLIYSLREFDQILNIFKNLESSDEKESVSAELNLRRIFIDEVDIKKGRGSINNLTTAQGMEFVTLRDSFLVVKDLPSIDELNVNDRVKRILKDRFGEYLNWKEEYRKDMEGRRKLQKQYLKNQVESMKMQLDWARPYFTIMQQLNIGTGVADPDLLAGLDTSVIKTKIRGVIGGEEDEKLATAFIDVEFNFKTSPIQVRSERGQAYHHIFKTEITYTPYIMSNEDYAKIVQKETMRDINFLKELVGESLESIKDDLEKYLGGEDIKEAEEKKAMSIGAPFEFLIMPFRPLFGPIFDLFKKPEAGVKYSRYQLENDKKELTASIIDKAFSSYENFKDENGLITWSATLA
jgi:hypothetical protein